MKEEITKLFKETIVDTPHPFPLRYYGRLQTLAGLVYDKQTDNHMDNDLSELSHYVQFLSNLDELEGQVRQLVPSRMATINFPEMNQEISENIINMVLEKFKGIRTYDFNVARIIGWVNIKIQSDGDTTS